ncbi:uncharacterized protein BO72DRAFT_502342 [Aspergillus fijiensis CBS 313.89]|uniref:Uncharacterized protein n=1 Tax=Aspergillus fijiensis CBS 313.89 TaxID=1448319 RepID=A0A8G1VTE3_9EURO|nr:uncharacterized protein BO72DRAFT_502342 [Aspergillus fijiensis CBS 313.89]RAK70998.1 hypothetical protein BO72DRAFT_502342 [Aspergillus fijiensis CBS 313.89]
MAAVSSPEQNMIRSYVTISLLIMSLTMRLAQLLHTHATVGLDVPLVLLPALSLLVAWIGSLIVFGGGNLAPLSSPTRSRSLILALAAADLALAYLNARQPNASALAYISCLVSLFQLGLDLGLFIWMKD